MKNTKFFIVWAVAFLLLALAGGITQCTTADMDRPVPAISQSEEPTDVQWNPVFSDECVWNGVVYDYRELGCGFVIRLEDEYHTILVPVTMPDPEFRMFEGQMVAVGYNIHGNQSSTCQAGVLAEIFCIRETGVDRGIFNDKAPSDDDLSVE